jgi:hypothetical protein
MSRLTTGPSPLPPTHPEKAPPILVSLSSFIYFSLSYYFYHFLTLYACLFPSVFDSYFFSPYSFRLTFYHLFSFFVRFLLFFFSFQSCLSYFVPFFFPMSGFCVPQRRSGRDCKVPTLVKTSGGNQNVVHYEYFVRELCLIPVGGTRLWHYITWSLCRVILVCNSVLVCQTMAWR